MKGLIIKPKWAELILNGEKTWELRGSNTNIRGTIGIIESKTGKVFGTVDLIDTIQLGEYQYRITDDKHQVEIPYMCLPYSTVWAWVLTNPVRFKEPIPYKHKQGCVIWVNLDNLEGLE